MKKLITLSAFLFFLCFTANAQPFEKGKVLPPSPPVTTVLTEADGLSTIKGVSPFTAFLVLDMSLMEKDPERISEAELMNRYALIKKGNTIYANAFLLGTEQFSINDLRQLGVIPGSKSGKVYTALVPISKIREVAGWPSMKYLEIGTVVATTMDSARSATGVNKVHQGMSPLTMGYTGKDVVVGIIDHGIDFTHPNFYDTTGTANYRIKRVWKQTDNSGAPPNGFAYGTEFTTQSAILAAKTDDSSYGADGNHGSHTAGIAAGAGGYPNSPYKGVAYESDIVVVSGPFSASFSGDAIEYIQGYAASVSKPCVINMSFGGHLGPHDGTTLANQFEDSATGPGKLLVRAAGNDGANPMYLEHHFMPNDSLAKTFMAFLSAPALTKSNGSGLVLVYGQPLQNFSLRVLLYNSATDQYEDAFPAKIPAAISLSGSYTMMGTNNIPVGFQFESGIDPINNRPFVGFIVNNSAQPDGVRKVLIEITGYNTTVQMWGTHIGHYSYFTSNGFMPPVYNGTTDHTSANDICGNGGAISVGAYTSKVGWVPLNNVPQMQSGLGLSQIGDIAQFSSVGPTADGRVKPDITAPGNILASSVNSFSPMYDAFGIRTVKSVTHGSNTWLYGMMEGTSMAAPMVTGILALWLQQNPNLTREQAIAKMKATAITDNFTGTIPANGSNTWGWGKINAFAGLVTVSVENVPNQFGMKIYPNPATTELNIAFDEKVLTSEVVIFDITGKTVFSKNVKNISAGHVERIGTEVLASGSYILKINNDGKVGSYKIVKQ